ncbi:MAG TPA: hypothetical protein VNM22_11140 [Candidatus Limnocylindrales bacterium]|nr:hypothetical protein [Candidatus Limnocylindrales bacterium]
MLKGKKILESSDEDNPFIMSVGDLMASLLLIFILLLSATLLKLEDEYRRKRDEADRAERLAQEKQKVAD